MDSSPRNRAIAFLLFTILIMLPLASASAAPWGPASPPQAGDTLLTELWQWLASLLGGGDETSAATTCSAVVAGGRGCAIDPNGSPSN